MSAPIYIVDDDVIDLDPDPPEPRTNRPQQNPAAQHSQHGQGPSQLAQGQQFEVGHAAVTLDQQRRTKKRTKSATVVPQGPQPIHPKPTQAQQLQVQAQQIQQSPRVQAQQAQQQLQAQQSTRVQPQQLQFQTQQLQSQQVQTQQLRVQPQQAQQLQPQAQQLQLQPQQLQPQQPQPQLQPQQAQQQPDQISGPSKPRPNLSWFSNEEIFQTLALRQAIYVCICGSVFQDKALYVIHRSAHDPINPQKCGSCGFLSRGWPEFLEHFINHRTVSPLNPT